MKKLQSRVAIVTAGASGIGRAIATRFADHGAVVYVADVDEQGGRAVTAELAEAGHPARFVRVDVTRWADLERVIEAALAEFGRVDVMVNGAGLGLEKPLQETSEADFDRVVAANLKAAWMGARLAAVPMIERRSGVIINISSIHGLVSLKNDSVYAATQGAIMAATRSMALDLACYGVRVNCISAGRIAVRDARAAALGELDPACRDEFFARYGERLDDEAKYGQPLRVVGVPAHIAGLALYLASDDGAFVTGANLVADGGASVTMINTNGVPEEVRATARQMGEYIEAHRRRV